MTRFVPQGDMSADEIISCVVQASAIVRICEEAAWSIQNSASEKTIPHITGSIQFSLSLVAELLEPVQDALESHEGRHGDDDGAHVVVNVGYVLLEMLDAYRSAEERINRSSNDATDENVMRLTDAAMAIIAYRPLAESDARRKAEFPKEYTDGTLLTEQEQTALIASLMPEGGAS